jgi:ribonuclease HI
VKNKVTNNNSELTAILQAFKQFDNNFINKDNLIIKSDSSYCINSLTIWYPSWKKNNWKNSAGKEIINKEIILYLVENYLTKYKSQITFAKLKAHQKEPSKDSILYQDWYGNMMADKLAINSHLSKF